LLDEPESKKFNNKIIKWTVLWNLKVIAIMDILIFVPDISFIRSLYISTGLLPRGSVSGYRDKFCCLHKQFIIKDRLGQRKAV
jgi:hypothetical protein